jgi:hypothetical protein
MHKQIVHKQIGHQQQKWTKNQINKCIAHLGTRRAFSWEDPILEAEAPSPLAWHEAAGKQIYQIMSCLSTE